MENTWSVNCELVAVMLLRNYSCDSSFLQQMNVKSKLAWQVEHHQNPLDLFRVSIW